MSQPTLLKRERETLFADFYSTSYAELIQNRAFQGDSPTLEPWTAVGGASLALDNSTATLGVLDTSVKVTASNDGTAGIKNPGWWGSE